MISHVVIDIEGTTSATSFVADRLFPYSAERLAQWIATHQLDPVTQRAINQVREITDEPSAGLDRVTATLLGWLESDQKITPLKTLQGLIWEQGFADGDLVAHFYPDAVPALRAWKSAGYDLCVFSSGSVAAQRAWFANSADGDLRPMISVYFDTENAGPKRESSAYWRIANAINVIPAQIVFLSDVVAELDAARDAGWHTAGVRRPGEKYYSYGVGTHLEVSSLSELNLSGDRPMISASGIRDNT